MESEFLSLRDITRLFIFPKKTPSFHFFTLMKFIIDCILKKCKTCRKKKTYQLILKLFKGREGFTYKIKATFI